MYAVDYQWEEHREQLDPENDSEVYKITSSEDFKEWLKFELEFRFDELKDLFGSLGNKFPIYREMSVSSDYLQKMKEGKVKRIGRYWTYNKESAEAHWGHNNDQLESKILFESIIHNEHVDWIETFRLNLEHESMNEEKEIRLFKNTKLTLNSIIFDDKEISNDELEQINQYNYIS